MFSTSQIFYALHAGHRSVEVPSPSAYRVRDSRVNDRLAADLTNGHCNTDARYMSVVAQSGCQPIITRKTALHCRLERSPFESAVPSLPRWISTSVFQYRRNRILTCHLPPFPSVLGQVHTLENVTWRDMRVGQVSCYEHDPVVEVHRTGWTAKSGGQCQVSWLSPQPHLVFNLIPNGPFSFSYLTKIPQKITKRQTWTNITLPCYSIPSKGYHTLCWSTQHQDCDQTRGVARTHGRMTCVSNSETLRRVEI